MAEEKLTYEQIRENCIAEYRNLYKDQVVFDACEVPKETRIRLLNDPFYISKTKAIKANLFKEQLGILNNVLAGVYQGDKPTDQSTVILKALEMKRTILLSDLEANKDESNALNVTFTAMDREAFEALETVEVNEGGNSTELGADFGVSEDTDSFEARLKAEVKDRMKQAEGESK